VDKEAKTPKTPVPVQTVAAIDIGANSLRMVIAEVLSDGKIRVLDKLQRAVRLGQDTFRYGRLSGPTMRSAIAVLRDYRQVLDFFNVEQIRAVATSAVREASNSDTFLDRIFMATSLDIEVIVTSEESRLTVSAVREALSDSVAKDGSPALIADVGGGNTILTILHKGEIIEYHSLPLGSVRLQEVLSTTDEPPNRAAEILQQQISNEISNIQTTLPLKKIKRFIAVGGDVRFAARQIGKPTESSDLHTISRTKFDKFVQRCERYSTKDLAKRYGIPFADAETLNPALLVYKLLLQATRARETIVSQVTMRDGLLLDLIRRATGKEDPAISKGVIHSALAMTEKHRVDLNHAQNVAELSVQLFDKLQSEHGLGQRHRLLLRVAALVHEIGSFISNRAHHKHSYYLISNSEIFGLTRNETIAVAHVARYHRRSCPKPSHLEYMNLPRERRMVISKLAAILRVADALDASHTQQVHKIRCERREEAFVIYTTGVADLSLKRRAIVIKGDLFEDIYGLKVRLEDDGLSLQKPIRHENE